MGKLVAAGKLDRRLQILSRVVTQDANGAPVTNWPELATVWAARWYLNGTETDVGDGSTQQVLAGVKFMLRYRDDVTSDMQLVCEGATFNITGIEEIGRREGLFIYAVARTA